MRTELDIKAWVQAVIRPVMLSVLIIVTGFPAGNAVFANQLMQVSYPCPAALNGITTYGPGSTVFPTNSLSVNIDTYNCYNSIVTKPGGNLFSRPGAEIERSIHIHALLESRYRRRQSDPHFIKSDLWAIAGYYARYPEVVAMLDELKDLHWHMKFSENTWSTRARGNTQIINSLAVQFDSRTGVKMQAGTHCQHTCTVSPADALLHELLHVLLLQKSSETGDMEKLLIHPYEHERKVIEMERAVYMSMSRRDGTARPQRYQHSGYLLPVKCPVCTTL